MKSSPLVSHVVFTRMTYPDFALKAYRLANATYALWTYGRIVWNSQLLVVFWSHLVLWLEIEIFCWVSLMTNIFTLSNKLAR